MRPEQFLFSVVTSVLLGMVMNVASRSQTTEGRQIMFGIPKTDIERLMSHYGISEEEAAELLASYSIDLLLPERGSRLAPIEIIGNTQQELASGLMVMEGSMSVGEKARLTFCTEGLPSDEDLAAMYLEMTALGCHVSYPTASVIEGIPTTEFVMQKGSPAWPLIIPLIIPILTIGLITFGIFKLETITKAIMPIILVTVGGVIVIAALFRKPAEKYIERGGKVPYLPETKKKQGSGSLGRAMPAKAKGWDNFLGRDYRKGDKVVWVTQSMFSKELPPFLNDIYVIPASFAEMAKIYQLKKALAVR